MRHTKKVWPKYFQKIKRLHMRGKIKTILLFSMALFIILGFAFYWSQWRPSEIRKECVRQALKVSGAASQASNYSFFYELCLKAHGLEK